jgi:anthranilate phosphoribosyltransferase
MIQEATAQVVDRKNLTAGAAKEVMRKLISGSATDAQIGAFLTAMRMKGETEDELEGFALAMREVSKRIVAPPLAIDMCGTGGDGARTFNISTAASFVVAAAGVPVAKHGNRSVSSMCGSADVLSALGIPIDLPPVMAQRCLDASGMCFMFAPIFHPSMRNVVGPRKEIGLRTIFNILGPMTNPAGVRNQLIGTYDIELGEKMARVLSRLGSERAMLVNGCGVDEITNTGPTEVVELKGDAVTRHRIDPGSFGLDQVELAEIAGGNGPQNARIIMSVLRGERSPRSDVVALNAAAGIYVSGITESMYDGLDMAREALASGRALAVAKRFAETSWELEAQRQSEEQASSLIGTRIHPDVLRKRAAELTRTLDDELKRLESGTDILRSLDESLLLEPSVLSVLVLHRALTSVQAVKGTPDVFAQSPTGFAEALSSSEGLAVIAEYKPRSPSSPPLVAPPDADEIIATYSSEGVAAVSVLTEPTFFSGSLELFASVRSKLRLPMLFKDFVVSKAQVDTAARLGADAILLIAKALKPESLDKLVSRCVSLGIETFVEVHDEGDIRKVIGLSSYDAIKVLGINSRDLRTLRTDMDKMAELRKMIVGDKIVIAESGVRSREDIRALSEFNGVLVGTAFMQADDIRAKVRELVAGCRSVSR